MDKVATATRNGSTLPTSCPNATPSACACGSGQPLEQTEDRSEQPVQRGERQRGLRLQPLGAQHPHVTRRGQDLGQESRLPHARFPVHHDAAGRPAAGVLDECGQARQLDASPMQHVATVPLAGAVAAAAADSLPAIPAL